MIKTRQGFSKWSNGYVTLFFLDCNQHSFRLGVDLSCIDTLIAAACLELDADGLRTRSNWGSVKSEFDLVNHIKGER